ncbi:MAG: four helix bundle protein [Flavobacteriales bacterium]|jgi:four helix bundle protein
MKQDLKGPLQSKSFVFGVDTYRLCAAIWESDKEWILTRQLMRSSTSIGALCAESEHAQSKLDFINKLSIARKECNESKYWIAMMLEVGLLTEHVADKLGNQAEELMRLLTSSIRTAQANLRNSKGS